MRHITLGEIFTDDELIRIGSLSSREQIRDEIIKPNMDRINRATGQENDPDYLAYAIVYSMRVGRIQERSPE
jgi:hypothetical protein